VRLKWARITGVLDLSHARTHVLLRLNHCVLDEPCDLSHSHLPHLDLDGCRLTQLHGAGLRVDGHFYLRGGFRATGSSEWGTVRLPGAHIGGVLSMAGADLTNDTGPALYADSLQVDQDLLLDGGFRATGSGERGSVRLPGAHIGSQLNMNGANLTNDTGPALYADSLQVDQALFLTDGFRATGSGALGTVRLHGAHIGGVLSMNGANLTNDTGPALYADSLQVDQALFLTDGFRATGSGALGTVRLHGAHIGSQLSMRSANLTNDTGPALCADSLQVDQDLLLDGGFQSTSSGEQGSVRLRGAHRRPAQHGLCQPAQNRHRPHPGPRRRRSSNTAHTTGTDLPTPGNHHRGLPQHQPPRAPGGLDL
jgi:hypothetical protein